ncbi:unnamed protein product [Ectocarpus sp. 8 AP-2014]
MKDEISLRMESVPEDLMSTLYQFQAGYPLSRPDQKNENREPK